MVAMRSGSPTWLAAIPAPSAACIVSTRSSISACTSAVASSSRVTSRAGCRSAGWPTVRISRTAMRSFAPDAENVAGGVAEVEATTPREVEDGLGDLPAGRLDPRQRVLEVVGLEHDERRGPLVAAAEHAAV